MKFISIKKPNPEQFDGRKIMADPYIHDYVASKIKEEITRGSTILEIGSGAGAFTKRLSKMGYKVKAVDIDSTEYEEIDGVEFFLVKQDDDLSKIFGNEQFDAVVAIEVIEHVKNTWNFLINAKKMLSPNGKIFLTTPNLSSFYSRLVFLKEGRFFHFQGPESWKMGHINPLPFFVLEQIAKDIGLNLFFREGIGQTTILDWSKFKPRVLFTAIPRLFLFMMMGGPGPKDGNILFYGFDKNK